jgi:hypothetical protein
MNEQHTTARLFGETEPRVPHSAPPDLEHLIIRLRKRRRARRILGTSVLSALGVLLIACAHEWNSTRRPQRNRPGDAVVRADTESSTDSRETAGPSGVEPMPESLAGVRVFAKVHQPIPVFGRQEGTEYIRHVGWIDSEELVPVDLSRFPLEQQKSIEAVLHEDQTNPYFSL